MKPAVRGVALVELAAAAAGCGGHPSSTRLKIEVSERHGVHAYRLQCDPAGGSALLTLAPTIRRLAAARRLLSGAAAT